MNHIEHAVPLGDEMQNELLKEISTSSKIKLSHMKIVRKTICTLCSLSSQSNIRKKKKNRHAFYEGSALHFDLHRRK